MYSDMKKLFLFLITALAIPLSIQAKSNTDYPKLGFPMEIYIREEIYPIIEVETLNSDSSDYDNSIAKHIKETVKYDQDFLESGILGRVIVTFTITKEGKVTNEKIIRGVYDRLDKDVLIAIKELNEWLPTQNFSIKDDREFTVSIFFNIGTVTIDKNGVYLVVDYHPDIAQEDEFYTKLYKKLKYPKKARKEKIEGVCVVECLVEADGTVSDATIDEKNTPRPLCPEIYQEAIRLAKASKGWIPAQYKGKNVRSYGKLPIIFRLKEHK